MISPRQTALQSRPSTSSLADAPRLAFRACWLLILLLPPLLLLIPALLFPTGSEQQCRWRARFEEALLRALERGGPCLTKLGQWASTRPDLLPPSLCATLASLHHSVRPHSLAHTKRAIADAFGSPAEELLLEVSDKPVGSGCIAQVHTARARDGRQLAVKVLHPNVARLVADDLYLMQLGAGGAQAVLGTMISGLRWLAVSDALDEFAHFMGEQLDLTREAANLDTFTRNFGSEPRIIFPQPVRSCRGRDGESVSLVSTDVLVETFLEGQTLSAMIRDDGTALEDPAHVVRNAELANLGLRAFLTMLLHHNFIHADLHPGNILVSGGGGSGGGGGGGGSGKERYILGMVDAGLVVQLKEQDRRNFLALFRAIGDGDGALAGKLMLTRAKEQRCAEPEAFIAGMRDLVAAARAGERGAFNLRNLKIGDVLLQVTDLVRTHQVQVDASFTTLVCAIVVLEGLGRQLDPNLDLFYVALDVGF